MKAFISYSHRDTQYLERLKVHLAQARRDSLISEWNDQEIKAGDNLDNHISEALLTSELFLALVSPDYIASNYCFEKEFQKAIKMQEEGKLTIVPIIVEPCEWQKTPFGKLKAIPKDGKPISEYTNQNNAFLNVVDELRRLLEVKPMVSLVADNIGNGLELPSAKRNYKVKKTFSGVDKVDFIEESFNKIVTYFKASIAEINDVENIQAKLLKLDDNSFTCLISNRANLKDSYLTVSIVDDRQMSFGDLHYSFSEQISENSIQMDKLFNVSFDDYDIYWKNHDLYGFRQNNDVQLTSANVAEIIWNNFIEQVGIS